MTTITVKIFSGSDKEISPIFEIDGKDEVKECVHRGISKRLFTNRFTLADEVVVIGAELKVGMLRLISGEETLARIRDDRDG